MYTLAKHKFHCTSAAIARGGTVVLMQHTAPDEAAAAQCNTKRGKPHRATPKAGLWDEPPQLAHVLANGFYSGLTARDQQKLRTK